MRILNTCICTEVKIFALKLDIKEEVYWVCHLQTACNNVSYRPAKEYYRWAIYVRYLYGVCN